MDDQVTLKDYVDEVRSHIHSGRHDDALAICQHILRYYPKHLDSYRLMAEASLEKGENESALELFRRVLGADPENVVAYTGLAIIYQQQSLGNEALWHMERAYELAPMNLDIRERLLRLHADVDRKAMVRLKLTPGALARLYVQEGLYYQAAQEFRSIATASPKRFDARVALVETLWHAGRVREAAETAQALLHTLPYCLKANLLLGTIWSESGLRESETYLENARAVDPTNQVAHDLLGKRSPLRVVDVTVPRYVPGIEPPPMPVPSAEPSAEPSLSTDWYDADLAAEESTRLDSQREPAEESGIVAPTPALEGAFFTPSEIEPPVAVEHVQPEPPAKLSTTEIEPTVGVEQIQSLLPQPPAELPTTEIEPTGGVEQIQSLQPQPPAESPTTEVEPSIGVEHIEPPQPQPPAPAIKPSRIESDLPPWLEADLTAPVPPPVSHPATGHEETDESGLPAWLVELQRTQSEEPGAQATELPGEKHAESGLPAWISSTSAIEEQPTSAGALSEPGSESSPEWIDQISAAEETAASATQAEPPADTLGLPAWLTGATAEPPVTGTPVAPPKTDMEEFEAALDLEMGKPVEPSAAPPAGETSQDLPDWLKAWQPRPDLSETPGGAELISAEALRAEETRETLPEKSAAELPVTPEKEIEPTEEGVPAPPGPAEPPVIQAAVPTEMGEAVAPVAEQAPVAPVAEQAPVEPLHPVPEEMPSVIQAAMPAEMGEAVAPVAEQAPVAPVAEQAPVAPVAEQAPIEPVHPVSEEMPPAAQEIARVTEPVLEFGEAQAAEQIKPVEEQVKPLQEIPVEAPPARLIAPEITEPVAATAPMPAPSLPRPPVELPAPEQLPVRAQPVRRRRAQKGTEYLEQARAYRDANRLSDALAEYDKAVQHAPRLINQAIPDLEEIILRPDAPLEAHRILGDAYTRADRLAEALERYRFVLDRVS